jgi:glyoxylase-like metal-dependent hydrolase (beta-lactamase superfamily II)
VESGRRERIGLTAGYDFSMSTAAQSSAELIAAYLDAVIRKDAAAVDRYFDRDVEYMVNGTLEFGECESKHMASLYAPALKTLFSADLVYNGAHLYVAEKHIASWLERLDELAAFAGPRVSVIQPGHGAAGGLDLIAQTRAYLNDFAQAVQSGDAKAVEQEILAKYPEYHVKQFLTVFSIPAFFPAASSA